MEWFWFSFSYIICGILVMYKFKTLAIGIYDKVSDWLYFWKEYDRLK